MRCAQKKINCITHQTHGVYFLTLFAQAVKKMQDHKKQRRHSSQLSSLVPELLQIVVAFAAPTLADVTALAELNRHFKKLMSSPSMAHHVRANFTAAWDRLGTIGPLVRGIRAAHAQAVSNLHQLSFLPSLRVLELPHGEFDSGMFNEAMACVPYLLTLNVSSCAGLSSILALPATLRVLNVSECTNLHHLPSCLPDVYDLNANRCAKLLALPRMPKIQVLRAIQCPATLVAYPTVRRLDRKLVQADLSVIAQCTALEMLDLTACEVTDLDFIATLKKLVSLSVEFAEQDNFMDLSALASGFKNLKVLHLENDITDEHLDVVKSIPDLFSLTLMSHLLTDDGLSAIAHMKSLTCLTLDNYDCLGITADGFAACADLTGLRKLSLKYCIGIEDVSTLVVLSGLRELNFVGCMAISNLGSLSALQGLDTLTFDSCDSVTTLEGLNQIPNLAHLAVLCCRNLSRGGMWALLPCPKLQKLKMCEHRKSVV